MLISSSTIMKKVVDLAEKASKYPVDILIFGETGCGKELLARHIHETRFNNTEIKGKFVGINCAALPPGLLESELFGYKRGAFTGAYTNKKGIMEEAGVGSLLLDEIGEMPMELQPKLLRVLDTKVFSRLGDTDSIKFKAKIISTTNANLANSSIFRPDLYFRLSAIVINIPPLKERPDDVISLTNYILGKIVEDFGLNTFPEIDKDIYNILLSYSWPGNVRELQNMLKRAIILGDGYLKIEIIEEIIEYNSNFFNLDRLPYKKNNNNIFIWKTKNNNYDLKTAEKDIGKHLVKSIIESNPGISYANIANKLGICAVTLNKRFKKYL